MLSWPAYPPHHQQASCRFRHVGLKPRATANNELRPRIDPKKKRRLPQQKGWKTTLHLYKGITCISVSPFLSYCEFKGIISRCAFVFLVACGRSSESPDTRSRDGTFESAIYKSASSNASPAKWQLLSSCYLEFLEETVTHVVLEVFKPRAVWLIILSSKDLDCKVSERMKNVLRHFLHFGD